MKESNEIELMEEVIKEDIEVMEELVKEEIMPLIKHREKLEKQAFEKAYNEVKKLEQEV